MILQSIIGAVNFLLYILWVFILCLIIFPIGILRYVLPFKSWRVFFDRILNYMPVLWGDGCELIMRLTTRTKIEVINGENLPLKEWYLMTANHQTWTDILILLRAFNRKLPVLKFFIKSQILWMPFVGWACYLMGYPFMKRYTKEQIAKNPSLKGKDLETTRKSCKRFKHVPMVIISFAEGTRYTPAKAKRQKSPYKHLLKPRAGGLAYTLTVMGDMLHHFVDITIFYTDEKFQFWDYLCGRVKHVIVKVESRPITQDLLGDYVNDREYRVRFQSMLNEMWQRKDEAMRAWCEQYPKSGENK